MTEINELSLMSALMGQPRNSEDYKAHLLEKAEDLIKQMEEQTGSRDRDFGILAMVMAANVAPMDMVSATLVASLLQVTALRLIGEEGLSDDETFLDYAATVLTEANA